MDSAAGGGPSSDVTETGTSPAPGFRIQRRARSPEWQAARKEADAKAKTLADEQRFGEAIEQYESPSVQSHDTILREWVDGAVAELKTRAAQAYGEIEARARQMLAENKFAEARAQLQPVVERFGITEHVAAANTLLSEIAAAELAAAPKEPPAPPQPTPEELAAQQSLERQRQMEARYAEAIKPVEMLAATWDFARAAEEIDAIHFEEEELAARLTQRRDELRRMHDLKQKIIAAINNANPPFRKSDLGIKGTGGDVTAADEEGFTARLLGGKTEIIPWSTIGAGGLAKLFAPKQFERFLTSAEGDDWLAAGLVAMTVGSGSEAERCFEQASSLGVNIGPYLASLAAAAFAEANTMLANYEYAQADTALGSIEEKYVAIPWYPANKQAIAAAQDAARIGIAKTQEADSLYAEAVRLLGQKELFDVKDLVQKLTSEFADTNVVVERGRDPSLLDLENAVANVPKAITVRLDGKGDFQSIQAAIDAAPSQSLIEIEDNGPYREKVLIPKDKYEVRLRGKRGCWPVITSEGLPEGPLPLVGVEGSGAFLERMVLLGNIAVSAGDVRLRWLIAHGNILTSGYQRKCKCEECLVTASGGVNAPAAFRNCLFVGSSEAGHRLLFQVAGFEAYFCTILPNVVNSQSAVGYAHDSVLGSALFSDSVIEKCVLLAGNVPEQNRSCFKADPLFVDPQNFDYRLKPTSPCIGKASDGGDIGCRYTPEMIEMCQKALELRRQGVLKF